MTKKIILLVDDDQRLRDLLKDYLNEKGLKIFTSEDFIEAKEVLNYFIFDLIILDRMMPSGDGIDLIHYIKKKYNTPIIMLTAMGEDNNKIKGLKTGADDYVSKPFEPEELYLRIKNLLNFYNTINKSETRIEFGKYVFDIKTNNLSKDNALIYLTEGESNLLLKLIKKRNYNVTREELADKNYDENELRKVDVGITRLRQKIEETPKHPNYIKTIRGKGYMLVCKDI